MTKNVSGGWQLEKKKCRCVKTVFPVHSFCRGGPPTPKIIPPQLQLLSEVRYCAYYCVIC